MKIFKLPFFLLLGISVLSSCAKKTDNPAPAPTSSMSATIGSTAWTANSVSAVNSSGYLVISGSGSNSSYITVELPASATASTDSIPSTSNYAVGYSNGSTVYTMSKGAIVITSNSGGTVSGTFSGTLSDPVGGTTVALTKGAFTAKY